MILYLNDCNTGGETEFENVNVKPRQGTVVVFDQSLEHSGALTNEIKYTLRTDILVQGPSPSTGNLRCMTNLNQ